MYLLKQRVLGVCVIASLTIAAGCSQKAADTTSTATTPPTGMGTSGAQRNAGGGSRQMMDAEPAPAGVKTDLSGGRK